jgi:tetratricopeptide (TPR) repeat protein
MLKIDGLFAALLSGWMLSGLPALAQPDASQMIVPLAQDSQPAASRAPASDFDEARRLLQQGKYDEALAALHDIEGKRSELRGLAHEFGVAYYKKGDYLNAIASLTKDYSHARTAFAKMFGVPAESGAGYLFTARMLLRQDFGPVAEDYAQKATALDPKLPLAHFLLGELNLYHSKIPEAIAEFQKELELNPGYAPGYYKLADAYSRIQKFDEAEKLLQRSIWLDATSTGPYILMGKVLEKKGETQLAVRALQRALAMDPNNPIPHHLLGQAYRDMGRSEDAERELRLAGELEEHQNAKP